MYSEEKIERIGAVISIFIVLHCVTMPLLVILLIISLFVGG